MKLKTYQQILTKQKIGLSLFYNFDADNVDPNIVYFSGYTGFGVLGITPKKAFLLVPGLEYLRAKKTSCLPVKKLNGPLSKTLKKEIGWFPKVIGIDKNRVPVSIFEKMQKEVKAKYVDMTEVCLELRATKTPNEIKCIKKACKLTDEIFQKTFWNFRKFKTESDVAAFMEYETKKIGCEISFKTIVASGANGAEAHHMVTNTKLKKGFCVIDFGLKYKGYCSDMTRTIYLGEPTKKEIDAYYKVLDVQQKSIKQCKAGIDYCEIEKFSREKFGKLAKNFGHLIGHGLGIEVHEVPNPKKTVKRPITILKPGSVITIEPGLYYPGKFGIRIEDDVLITSKGPQVLTKTGKNLLIIK